MHDLRSGSKFGRPHSCDKLGYRQSLGDELFILLRGCGAISAASMCAGFFPADDVLAGLNSLLSDLFIWSRLIA